MDRKGLVCLVVKSWQGVAVKLSAGEEADSFLKSPKLQQDLKACCPVLLVSHFLLMVVDDMHDGWNAVSLRMKISVNERMNAGGKHNN